MTRIADAFAWCRTPEPVPLLDRVFPPAQCVHDADRYFGDLARRRQWLTDQAAS